MQIDAKVVLRLAEISNNIAFFDIEATGLNCDYNSIVVCSVKPYKKKPVVFSTWRPGDDKALVRQIKQELEKYPIWCGYYSKMYDVPMIQGRLLRHGIAPLVKSHHIDLYFQLNANINTSRKSQGHRIGWLGLEENKMFVSADEWNKFLTYPKTYGRKLRARCASDTIGLEQLFERTKSLIVNITR